MTASTVLVKVSNTSTKPRDLYESDGSHSHITAGGDVNVNSHLDGTKDTKIQINHTDIRRYLLKYESSEESTNNILINDTFGRNNKVADTRIWTKNAEEDVEIKILEDTITISASEKHLKIYQSDGELSGSYQTVVASHKKDGGIEITGVDEED